MLTLKEGLVVFIYFTNRNTLFLRDKNCLAVTTGNCDKLKLFYTITILIYSL